MASFWDNPFIGASLVTMVLASLAYGALFTSYDVAYRPAYEQSYTDYYANQDKSVAEARQESLTFAFKTQEKCGTANMPCEKPGVIRVNDEVAAIIGDRNTRNVMLKRFKQAHYPIKDWRPVHGYKVSKALLLAIMKQESNFNPYAKSRVGARGVMQIMPDTARYIIKKKRLNEINVASTSNVAIPEISTRTLHKPAVNMAIGQAYIEYLANKPYIQGDLVKILAAYNAGPGSLKRWNNEFGDHYSADVNFVKQIPYKETRDYVRKVVSNYLIYCYLLGEKPEMNLFVSTL